MAHPGDGVCIVADLPHSKPLPIYWATLAGLDKMTLSLLSAINGREATFAQAGEGTLLLRSRVAKIAAQRRRERDDLINSAARDFAVNDG